MADDGEAARARKLEVLAQQGGDPRERLLDAIGAIVSGAPFPTTRSRNKATAILDLIDAVGYTSSDWPGSLAEG